MSKARKSEKVKEELRRLALVGENRKCMDCGMRGPLYAVLDFNIFVCSTCSSVHRSFQHRVKGVAMSEFTDQEVIGLKIGGNERAQQIWRKGCHAGQFPKEGDERGAREFVRSTYVDKRWYDEGAHAILVNDIATGDVSRAGGSAPVSQPPATHQSHGVRRNSNTPGGNSPSLKPQAPSPQPVASQPAPQQQQQQQPSAPMQTPPASAGQNEMDTMFSSPVSAPAPTENHFQLFQQQQQQQQPPVQQQPRFNVDALFGQTDQPVQQQYNQNASNSMAYTPEPQSQGQPQYNQPQYASQQQMSHAPYYQQSTTPQYAAQHQMNMQTTYGSSASGAPAGYPPAGQQQQSFQHAAQHQMQSHGNATPQYQPVNFTGMPQQQQGQQQGMQPAQFGGYGHQGPYGGAQQGMGSYPPQHQANTSYAAQHQMNAPMGGSGTMMAHGGGQGYSNYDQQQQFYASGGGYQQPGNGQPHMMQQQGAGGTPNPNKFADITSEGHNAWKNKPPQKDPFADLDPFKK